MLSKKYLKTPFYFKVLECSKVDRVVEKTLSQMQVSRIQKFSPTNHGRLRLVEQEREVLKCVKTKPDWPCGYEKYEAGIQREELTIYTSLLDIYSRFDWLVPLARKKSICVQRELDRIHKEYGVPLRLQSDNGGEFKKHVNKYCFRNKIKMKRFSHITLRRREKFLLPGHTKKELE